jgi:polysaccharide biosynthesis transport protein
MQSVQHDPEAVSLEQTFAVLRRRLPLIVLCLVAVAGAAYGFSKHQTRKYKATASLDFSVNSLSQQIAGLSPGASSSAALTAQQARNVELVTLGDTATKTAALLGHGLTGPMVASSLSVAGQAESGVVNVSATAASPVLAATIANTYTKQFVQEQQAANRQYFRSALASVHKQLAALSAKERAGPDGAALVSREQTLSLLSELHYSSVQLAQEARPPTGPYTPKSARNTALGAFLGLLLGVGLALLLERFDRRVRRPEDLERIYRLPLLGAVAKTAALARSARKGGGKQALLPPAEAEAFSLIRARLRFFNIDGDLRTILIASPERGDGKTTIARQLAEAAARFGSRVLLMEVDLRLPTLAQQLGIPSGPGLADVLIGAVPMSEAIQALDLPKPPGEGSRERTLDVLTAGAVRPPNPAELLESRAMTGALERATTSYDLIVIDTPPLTAVSDAFPLLAQVDGVVVVGWVGRSRRDAAEQLHQVLDSSGAPLLGVIANGTTSRGPTVYAAPGDGTPTSVFAASNGASSEEPVRAANA